MGCGGPEGGVSSSGSVREMNIWRYCGGSLVPVWREERLTSHFMLQLSSRVISQPGQQESELAAAGTTNITPVHTSHFLPEISETWRVNLVVSRLQHYTVDRGILSEQKGLLSWCSEWSHISISQSEQRLRSGVNINSNADSWQKLVFA